MKLSMLSYIYFFYFDVRSKWFRAKSALSSTSKSAVAFVEMESLDIDTRFFGLMSFDLVVRKQSRFDFEAFVKYKGTSPSFNSQLNLVTLGIEFANGWS